MAEIAERIQLRGAVEDEVIQGGLSPSQAPKGPANLMISGFWILTARC